MNERPDYLASGDEARLFPILAETSKEKRVASIFLAVMTQIPALAEEVLGVCGQRIGKRTRIRAYTEVVLRSDPASRPDGLIVVDTGRSQWSALIEAKIGKADLDADQVERYSDLARANGIEAVITISNQFTARADHSPVTIPRALLKKTDLYHWSWSWLATACEILTYQKTVTDDEQSYLLRQINHFLAHPATGVERFTQMAAPWKDVAASVAAGEVLRKTASEVEQVVAGWIAEERDLCLHMSSHVGREVSARIERKLIDDPVGRLRSQIDRLVADHGLYATIRVPDCAADIDVCADLLRKSIAVAMTVKTPADRKSTKARLNWLLRMLTEDDERLRIRAHWPGRAVPTMKDLATLRQDPTAIQTDNPDAVPHSFEVILIEGTGKRFGGRRTFIEDIERIVPEFYDLVGTNLRAWQASPPKPVKPAGAPDPGELETGDLEPAGALPMGGGQLME